MDKKYVYKNKMTGRYYMDYGVDIKQIEYAKIFTELDVAQITKFSCHYGELYMNIEGYKKIEYSVEIRNLKLKHLEIVSKY